MADDEAPARCGGRWRTTWGDGVYEVRCTSCGALSATGPAADRHWAREMHAGTVHDGPPAASSDIAASSPTGP